VPTSEHVNRLNAARLAWDVLGSSNLLIARTDSESAKLISSNIDHRDHEFIKGTYNMPEGTLGLAETLSKAEAEGAVGAQLDTIEKEWMEKCTLTTFDEAVEMQNKDNDKGLQAYKERVAHGVSNAEARSIAAEVFGKEGVPSWNWELPRTKEGYYHFAGGVAPAIKRVKIFAPYSDLLWLETKEPNLKQAQGFASEIHKDFPGKWLVYNLSPSFNWSAHGFSGESMRLSRDGVSSTDTPLSFRYAEKDLKSFVWDLAKSGFVLQLISLAGLHSGAAITYPLSKAFKEDGMLAYVNLIQRKEKEVGTDVLKHQAWSGAAYVDRMLQTISSGSSGTSAMGGESTEHSF
jgi:isocitrate lyase